MANYQAAPAPPADYPGKTLGIVGMVLAIVPCTSTIGLILSIVGFIQSASRHPEQEGVHRHHRRRRLDR